ncbi:AbrB/MazE/SpoVT family DNA-binding domain-containing protein [Halobellus ordinarius]|uniref:AbrB/MazE/SpoVT family DNA-binding domain-containing protein n=1 Tax=Halobellus ordinarius TaxID=3075120 RepID=UPI00288014D7|nr:AbrB/MazE/SpoVT family DNA-binding domain-containing protein [Halobellus sp. ZY16]
MPSTTVQVTESEVTTADGETRQTKQYRITVPKQMAEFFDLSQGDEIEWSAGSASNKIELTVND